MINSDVVVGEFELPFFKKDRIKVGPNGEWQLMRDYFDKPGMFTCAKAFTSNNGTKYIWKDHWGYLIMTYPGDKEPLIKYHHNTSGSSYLEVLHSSTITGLDTILLTFLIAERKKRDYEAAAVSAAS
ncbi:hypothetical protein M408DRAFT_30948 [Serendipita vermifera MAFF 305830]|uniref:DUF6593 domain-containing protein n=1 Tax=Serendipita vermifera MAFF 305830 TaxID=933852 RepID=A0A0C3AI58_SERVB|nr:hypothetical protein M408DRAFT_30948 [Serendipita vermifera MAFF 305830]